MTDDWRLSKLRLRKRGRVLGSRRKGGSNEVLKLYIAYKAETNFVDVVPQAKRLRLIVNLPFPELTDPRKLATDITKVGRWGNGDVEVRFEKLEDLPYVVGIILQALERQLGDESIPEWWSVKASALVRAARELMVDR